MNPFWSIVYFWEMTRFWWNFWWRSGPITSFFCAYFQVHRTHFEKVTSKNVFFHFFKNVKKHIHDAKNSSSQLLALWIFFIFGIRVKTLDSYFSAIQNVIWSRIDDFRTFWKLPDFSHFDMFFNLFFPIFRM